ncbi:PREDICTED: protein FAM208B [Nanorana parkeri]|uniref:protein FAM208B n=1 Tax=Nanorana parkeri TaxID=125878 RepID=UPI0008549287|nr:PREDICTED: protein FAM208B [Nanorana parkeri]
MPVLQDPDMLQLNSPELYNAWKGQLYIQEHLACDIKFKSSSTCSIPAQLPSKLKITEVIRLSELRKILPVQIFDSNFASPEVCCESVYYTLYRVITSNVNGFEFDKLQYWMKDQELALIKVLNDQGFLILLTSSALQRSKDFSVKDPFQLFALFLFPHTKLLDNTGREHGGYKFVKEDISLKITELLPGLQYAILETRQMQKGKTLYPDALVEQHFKQFTSLQRKSVSIGEVKAESSSTSSLSFGHGKDIPDKCDQLVFSRLQSYFSSPINFSVPLLKMSTLLKEDIPVSTDSEKCSKKVIVKDSVALESKIPLLATNKIKSDGSSGNNVLNENKKQPPKKRTFKKGGRRGARKGKRKHTQKAALSSSAASENQASNKRNVIVGDQQQAVSSNRTTVKLASAPYTPGRKRGAEVLTAEFVHDDKASETETTATNKRNKVQTTVLKNKVILGKQKKIAAAEDSYLIRDRPPRRKASDPGNRNKSPEVKAKSENMRKAVIKPQEQPGKKLRRTMESINTVSFEPVTSFSKSSMDLNVIAKQSTPSAPVPEIDLMEKRISMYESHALNLLADLALNSLSSSSISYINSESVAPISEPVVQETVPSSDSGNAVEYPQNDCSSPLQSSVASEEPVQAPDCVKSQPKVVSDDSLVNSTTQHRTENSEKQASHKVLIAAAKAKARNNTTSKISLEHSYSQLPRDDAADKSSKELNENPCQGVSEPTVTSPDNEEMVDQPSDLFLPRESLLGSSESGCPSLKTDPREVSKFQENFVITFKWEPKYDFDLDSKFTSDPLEKTINRALHGPWNPHLKEKVEDVKIILHMWLALFYSKPSQQLISSSRKVVEHSNPAKYVSINTVHDPLYEIAEVDADDTKNSDDSGLMSNYTSTRSQIMSDVSPEWHEMNEDNSSNQPVDLSVASSIQTKDYYVKLSSEIFQMYNQSSMSALYTNSLQTTVMCKMTSTSKVTPPPTNHTNTIFSANIPSVCYADDSEQFNNELTAKSETCVAIGGGSSGKVNPRESEHKYSKRFSSAEETQWSSGSEKGFNMLHEDSHSTVSKKDESAENYDVYVSPRPMSHTQAETFSLGDDRLAMIGDKNHPAAASSKVKHQEYTHVTSSTVDDAEDSPSDALNMNSTADVFHEDDGHSDHSEATGEDFLKKRSPLVSFMHSMQNIHANSERQETILESADSRIVLEAKLQDVRQNNEDKELDTSNVHLVVTSSSNGSELGMCKKSTYYNNDLKSSCEENQMDITFCNNDDLSPLTSSNFKSNSTPLDDGKVLESRSRLNYDNPPTLESPKAARISLELVHSEESSMQGESQDHATRNMDLAQSIKEADTCIGIELNDGKDSSVDPELTGNSFKEAKASSSTHEEIIERSEQSLDEMEKFQKETSSLDENDTNEVATFGNMDKLELSPSSTETSDVEAMDTENAGKSCPESSEDANEEKSYSNEKSDLVDTSTEVSVAVLHQDDARNSEDDGCQVNRNSVAVEVTDHSTEMKESAKTEETLPVYSHSPFPTSDLGADRTNSLTTVSANFQSKDTEAADCNFSQSDEMENISKIDEIEDPTDNTRTFCNQEVRTLNSAEISGKDPKTCFGENSSLIESEYSKAADLESMEERMLLASESSKVTDLESLGDKSSLLGPESSKAVDLESLGDKSSLLGPESSKAVDLESLGHKSSLLDPESSKAVDLESLRDKSSLLDFESSKAANLKGIGEKSSLHDCASSKTEDLEYISVFEKLNLKTVNEIYTTPTDAKKQELQTLDIENLPAEKETIDNNQSVELLNMQSDVCVLDTEDHMVPNTSETGNSCEVLQAPSSEPLNEVIALGIKSKSNETKDSDGAKTQPASRCVDGNVDQLHVESQSDFTSDPVSVRHSPDQPKKSTKVQTQSMRNTIRKEILSKLKLICRGSGISQHISSNSEDEVFIVHEKPGKLHTEEQKKQSENKKLDLAKPEINTVSIAESTSKTQETKTPESESLEESPEEMVQEMAANSPSITSAEPGILQEVTQLVSQDKCKSPLHDDFTDNIDQESGQDKSEICCILNTGSISKEQYDRWSETSDDDIEFIKEYKEPLTRKTSKYFQKECHEFPSSPPEEPASYPERRCSRKTKHFKRRSGPSASLGEAGEYVSRHHRDKEYLSPRSHGGIIITRKLKDVGKTWPTVHKGSLSAGRSDFDSVFTNRRRVSSDLTQNTLDMERLRFMCRLKDVLRKSSPDIHVSEPPFQTLFDSRRIPGGTSSRSKCINPLLITVHCKHRRRDYRGHDSLFPSSSYSHACYENELRDKPAYSRTSKKVRTRRYPPPYHFNRLKYESTLEKANNDISVIIKECTQSNHLKLSHLGLGSTAVERTSACPVPEQRGRQIRPTFDPTSTKSQTVGNIISDHCTNLRSRLHSVARDSAQKNCYFYLSKASDDHDDDEFFSLTKSLLMKDGYIPIEPQDFCDCEESESKKLLVIIRNENVSSQIHKSLFQVFYYEDWKQLDQIFQTSMDIKDTYLYVPIFLVHHCFDVGPPHYLFVALPLSLLSAPRVFTKVLALLYSHGVIPIVGNLPLCIKKMSDLFLPNVMFAGVDTPEDLSESMYQELLQTGGFVVSYKALLENISIDKLKEVLTVLEKGNLTSAWKWLIHYGEYRKLKEDKRAESISRIKISLLKSYQQSNVIEILPYHQCDSRSKDLSSDLECLLNLQSQHIRSRLAVCLTVMPSTEAEEIEHNGILVYDVDTFIRRIQKVDAWLQPSFW